mmetsp:Transcript_43328/g.92755  ORF Transcript_43328/g.92755 Transcript_43328/m.92755 type:complete len:636 (-) Transcript_43328:232-2139(-)
MAGMEEDEDDLVDFDPYMEGYALEEEVEASVAAPAPTEAAVPAQVKQEAATAGRAKSKAPAKAKGNVAVPTATAAAQEGPTIAKAAPKPQSQPKPKPTASVPPAAPPMPAVSKTAPAAAKAAAAKPAKAGSAAGQAAAAAPSAPASVPAAVTTATAAATAEPAASGPSSATASFIRASLLREEDQAAYEEDMERNAEQAERNAQMRSVLRSRRMQAEASEAANAPLGAVQELEEFMLVGTSESSKRRVADETLPPWFVERDHIDNVILRLHEELLDFLHFMKFTKGEVKARREFIRTIGLAARRLWPQSEVRIFGSFYTGLSLPNGDVDVAILNVPCRAGTAMKILADAMLERGQISWLELIESAKVPVLKIRSQSSGLRADIVFNMNDGLDTSKFIRTQCKEFPQMRPLLVFLKYLLIQRGLNDTYTGGMGSYLLCNVVLHFLQRHPSLREPRRYAATSLGHLLYDFMKYYGREFRYDLAVSVLHGGYQFRKEERGWGGKGKGKGGISLSLESPLGSPDVDLGGPCFRMSTLRNVFHHSFHCLNWLFAHHKVEDGSLICPLLLDPAHGVITSRHQLLAAQPAALVSRKQPEPKAKAKAAAGQQEQQQQSEKEVAEAEAEAEAFPPWKRLRTSST